MDNNEQTLIPLERITSAIFQIRGHKVILDRDLADLYGVSTGRLNEQVKRKKERFPQDFMFQLDDSEVENLRSQFAISSGKHGGRRYQPFVFTEHGALMAASVLNTKQAIQVSVFIVRAFVKMREMLATHKEVSHRLDDLERRLEGHDEAIQALIAAIRELMQPPAPRRLKVGFKKES